MGTYMKFKKIFSLLIVFTIIVLPMTACDKESELTKITLNEVAHSIFYAPQYAAIELGYFSDEGLEIELINGAGADKTMTAVLSGEADIGFMGSESTVYTYLEGNKDYVVNFAQLTQRAGNFLVSRENETNFDFKNLKGKTVIGGRAGGMPQMVFEYILKKNGIGLDELTIIQNIDFGITSQAFASGTGDYTVEFEPAASLLELQGSGYVVASLGVESGMVPYTAYSAKSSYIKENPEVIQKFTNAIQRGLDYVNSHTPEEIAKVIQPQFAETELSTITKIVERYYEQDTWKENLNFEESSFDLLQEILYQSGVIEKRAPYDALVTTEFSEKAVK